MLPHPPERVPELRVAVGRTVGLTGPRALVHRMCFRWSRVHRQSDAEHVFDSAATTNPPLDGWSAAAFAPLRASLRASLETGRVLLDLLREEQRSIGAAVARRARWIVEFCRSRPASNDRPGTEIGAAAAATRAARPTALAAVSEWAVDEVATALSITSARAEVWMVQSVQLVDRLPRRCTRCRPAD